MTELLIKYFIKDYEDVSNPRVRVAYGNLGSLVGILMNVLLCIGKMSVGLIFGSVAILADGINNLSDAGSSIVTLVGFKLSSKPADEDHPFGHARIEYISGLIVSFIILLLGVELVRSSISKILRPEPMNFSLIMVIILIISIVIKFWLSYFNKKLGNRIDSTAMHATAIDSRNDVIATTAVLIATLISHYTTLDLDGYMGVAVGCFIFYSGINLIRETTSPLLGQAPDAAFITNIEEKLLSYENISGIHDLVVHSYGPNRWFASVHVEVPADANLLHCHDIIDNIERDFAKELDINLVIHLDPIVTEDPKVNALKNQIQAMAHSIDEKLSIHDFRMVVGPTHSNIIFDITVPIGFKLSAKELAHILDTHVRTIDENFYTIITVDTNYISTSISSR